VLRIFLNALFWFLLALLFAATYASVESQPYAGGLPVWRPDPNLWWVKLLFWFPNLGRPVNGLDTFGLLFLGTTCLLLVPVWNALHDRLLPKHEFLELVAYFICAAVIEDWVWYAINPQVGLKRFTEGFLPRWMYSAWLCGFPSQYWEGLGGSYAAILASVKVKNAALPWRYVFKEALAVIGVLWGTMVLSVLIIALIANYTWMPHQNF
jgi:hypothetical protein